VGEITTSLSTYLPTYGDRTELFIERRFFLLRGDISIHKEGYLSFHTMRKFFPKDFRDRLQQHFLLMCFDQTHLFKTRVDKGFLWNLYLDTFPSF